MEHLRYNLSGFQETVDSYKHVLRGITCKSIMVSGEAETRAFFSIAPLSRAVHELGKDFFVHLENDLTTIQVLSDVWAAYEKLKKGSRDYKTKVFKSFLSLLRKKAHNEFDQFLNKPIILTITNDGFKHDDFLLAYDDSWFHEFMGEELQQTVEVMLREVYALKKNDYLGIGFELIPASEFLDDPLQDYLDTYPLCWEVYMHAKTITKQIKIFSSTKRKSPLDPPEPVTELLATLMGLEIEKEIDEPIFKKYKLLSNALNIDRLKTITATFAIAGKGYAGKHVFGEKIGYPTQNKKNRWSTPGQMLYKLPWNLQSKDEDRPPRARVGFTQTVPLDVFIKATNIDYKQMRDRNHRIGKVMKQCISIKVEGKTKQDSHFEVGLLKQDGSKQRILYSDSDARYIIDPKIYKESGEKMGMMANIPGGEAFTTPSFVHGTIIGDVTINLDTSYRLTAKEPLIILAEYYSYNIVSGPEKIIDKLQAKKQDAWEKLLLKEKNKSLPKWMIELSKKNFECIGEFAINTNPKAQLCNYLIINEKIAHMIHIALGSGFEPDKMTEYHVDIVINAPRQRLNIYGLDESREEHWIMKEGSFVV